MLHGGEYLSAGIAAGVVDGPFLAVGLSLIALSERCCSDSLCLPPVSVILIESSVAIITGTPLVPVTPSSWRKESNLPCAGWSLLELWRRLSGCDWWGGRLLGDLYGLVPVYGGVFGVWGPCSIGIASPGEEGNVWKVDIIPENIKLKCGAGW
ncbi:hypothetical protein ARMGADRAFT_1091958 [Armillaria gallica]|uniref:Uncharacterized protein n=1 Tax=Armillaria gallica TaxID=47427 RepID=A0A2H3CV91_ARMGA|nr:hypothetical protein ARMGADRAFT_1091958 [Armillaria gallica]